MQAPELNSLWDMVFPPGAEVTGEFAGHADVVRLADLASGSFLPHALVSLRGRSVLVATAEQLHCAVALLELDGVVRRMVLCTPDLTAAQLDTVAAMAQADAIVTDRTLDASLQTRLQRFVMTDRCVRGAVVRGGGEPTEWVLLTSGTTGMPKLVGHTLDSLAGALPRAGPAPSHAVWSTFYDIRRYGGLQIYLRAVLSRAALVLSSPAEPLATFLSRAAAAGVTHISGTPSHWRRLLMNGARASFAPKYLRLSGEIADQALLDGLRAAYPDATIAHAFASTEAGVAFDVGDGLAGFPATLLDGAGGDSAPGATMALKVIDGTLRIRSRRNAARYLGMQAAPIVAADGFVDTGDLVELIDGRYHFRGRIGGIINVGGLKVYPEEIEALLNADPRVRMSLVRGRRNPITGAIVIADVVLVEGAAPASAPGLVEHIKSDLLRVCRSAMPAYKVPAMLRVVDALELSAAGKLVRSRG